MSDLREALLKQQEEMEQLIECTAEAIRTAPEGFLRIKHNNKRNEYYHKLRKNGENCKAGKYIRKENIKLARSLAQKSYDKELLSVAKKNLAQIQRFLNCYQPDALEEVYCKLGSHRREIVNPRILSKEKFLERWENMIYKGKGFEEGVAEIYTNKGERVRSKSEKIIADMLLNAGIPYRYEYPVYLKGFGTVYPDFTVLNVKERKEIYWEHFGMMDNPDYCEKALCKIDTYIKNGIIPGDRLMITHETLKQPIKTFNIDKIIKNRLGRSES